MLLLMKNDLRIDSAKRLVKADEVATLAKASEIVAAAEAEAAKIVADAKRMFEEQRTKGYEKGLEDGRQEILQQKLDLLDESVKYMESVEREMGAVVMKALRKCVENIGDEDLIVQVVRRAMATIVRSQRQITLRVPADKVAAVKARMGEILKDYPAVNFTEVLEDPRLTGVSCVVETAAGMVETSISAQLAAIEKSIKRHFGRGDEGLKG